MILYNIPLFSATSLLQHFQSVCVCVCVFMCVYMSVCMYIHVYMYLYMSQG